MFTWAALAAGLVKAFNAVMDWLAGERLRDLGRLEQKDADRNEADEAARKAAEIDAQPDVADPERLLDGLRAPSGRSGH